MKRPPSWSSRRAFLTTAAASLAAAAAPAALADQPGPRGSVTARPRPTPSQLAWQREDRDKQEQPEQEIEELGEAKESERELYGSEDIIESQEEVLTEPAPLGQPAPEEE